MRIRLLAVQLALVAALALLLVSALTARAQPAKPTAGGDLDTSFGSGGKVTTDTGSTADVINAVAVQSDGKIIAAGAGGASGSYTLFTMARYNTNGSLDTSFGSGGVSQTIFNNSTEFDEAKAIAIQSDGKIVLGGLAYYPEYGRYAFTIARYNSDGSLDQSFGVGGGEQIDLGAPGGAYRGDGIQALLVQPDGSIVMAGYRNTYPEDEFVLVRVLSDGSIDNNFGDGGLVVTDLGTDGQATALTLQPDNKILAAGCVQHSGACDYALVRYNSDGSLDTSFGSNGIVSTDFLGGADNVNSIVLRPNGKIVLAGDSEVGCGSGCYTQDDSLAQYNADGSLDTSFGSGGKALYESATSRSQSISKIVLLSDGSLLAAGFDLNGFLVSHYLADGALDTSFGDQGVVRTAFAGTSRAYGAALENGKFVVGGQADDGSGSNFNFALARYTLPSATAATPTSTSTPQPGNTATATATRTPQPGATATNTPTSGCGQFSDVHTSDYFYTPVQYLSCHGVISGYGDNTFRPFNNTTRGQLAKIVALASGWQLISPGAATFRDVPVGSTFFSFVETAVQHKIISGYSDGTFRPNNNVTRGQLSKIIVLARGWALANPATPTFVDVPYGSTFYQVVESAVQHGVISGYDVSPGIKEFRVGNNATRGQIAKIVYLALQSN